MITMPTIDMAATGMNITRLRINAGLSVKDLADIFGFATPQAVYKWQHGVAMPTLDNLVVLAAVFGVSMDEIIARSFCVMPRSFLASASLLVIESVAVFLSISIFISISASLRKIVKNNRMG